MILLERRRLMMLPSDYPLRIELNDEVHARPSVALSAPMRVSYLALLVDDATRVLAWQQVQKLAVQFGVPPPSDTANHFVGNMGRFRIKCERHMEFLRLVMMVDGVLADPFAEPALAAMPQDWLAGLPGQVIVAVHLAILKASQHQPDFDRISSDFFDGNNLVGAAIAAGDGFAATDFKVGADGFTRLVVLDRAMRPIQIGQMVQRLLEIDTYRILALMALPIARTLTPMLTRCERDLADITHLLVDADGSEEPMLFARLTRLEAEIEREQSHNSYRFDAAAAYGNLVNRRIGELREERLSGLQTFREFTERRLAPAIDTCRSTAARQEKLSQRLGRVTQLLSTRVELTREQQTQHLLKSMDQRARMQLRLQETVEGLSIVAITYYIVGLASYMVKGLRVVGISLDVEIVDMASIPVVMLLTWLSLRWMRRAALQDHDS